MKTIAKYNNLLMQKKQGILIDEKDLGKEGEKVDPRVVLGALSNLETWNYRVDESMIPDFLQMTERDFVHRYYNPLVKTIQEIKGDNVNHNTFIFRNFPEECREKDPMELSNLRFISYFTTAIDNYLGTDVFTNALLGERNDNYVERERIPEDKLAVIGKLTKEDTYTVIRNILSSRNTMSEIDKELVDYAIRSQAIPKDKIIPAEVPCKETSSTLMAYAFDGIIEYPLTFQNYFDFKRTLAYLSDANTADNKFELKKLSTAKKKKLFTALESSFVANKTNFQGQMRSDKNFCWNMFNYYGLKELNVTPEFSNEMYTIINKIKFVTPEREKEEAKKSGDIGKYMEIVKCIPGEYFRNLAFILSNVKNESEMETAIEYAKNMAKNVPNEILLSARAEIKDMENPSPVKVVYAHTKPKMAHLFENNRKQLNKEVIDKVDKICVEALSDRLSKKLDYTGKKIYINPNMKDCPIPTAAPTSKGTRSLARGTKQPLIKKEFDPEDMVFHPEKCQEEKFLRFFVYKQIPGGGFVDLSVSFMDKNFNQVGQCSWTNLSSVGGIAVHSGDGKSCENGLSEFIDIDKTRLSELKEILDAKYIVMEILSYEHIPFANMTKCFCGVMNSDSGIKKEIREEERYKIFDPKLVETKIDITDKSTVYYPYAYDIDKDELIVLDSNIPGFKAMRTMSEKNAENIEKYGISMTCFQNYLTLEGCESTTALIGQSLIHNHYPTIYDLATIAAVAGKAELVDNIEDSDISFDWKGTITPYDREIFTSELLTLTKEEAEKEVDGNKTGNGDKPVGESQAEGDDVYTRVMELLREKDAKENVKEKDINEDER